MSLSSESSQSAVDDDAAEENEAEEDETVGLISNNNMEARAEHQKTKNYRLLYGLTTCVGISTVALVLIWCLHFRGGFAWNTEPGRQFNWHPLLMTTGLIFIYGQSALLYRTGSKYLKKTLKLWHAFLHLCAFVLAVIGLKAVFDSHNYAEPPIPNLYSLHSWIGLITIIIFSAQFVFGFVCFLYPGLSKTLRASTLPVHVAIGVATFASATIAAILGLSEKAFFSVENYSLLPSEGVLINFIGLLLGIFSILVLYLLNEISYKRMAQPEDELTLTDSTTD